MPTPSLSTLRGCKPTLLLVQWHYHRLHEIQNHWWRQRWAIDVTLYWYHWFKVTTTNRSMMVHCTSSLALLSNCQSGIIDSSTSERHIFESQKLCFTQSHWQCLCTPRALGNIMSFWDTDIVTKLTLSLDQLNMLQNISNNACSISLIQSDDNKHNLSMMVHCTSLV